MAAIKLKITISISTQPRKGVCQVLWFTKSNSPSVNYVDESKMATSKIAVSKMASFVVNVLL